MDRPFLGAGFEPFSEETYRRYLSEDLQKNAVIGTGAHSIFFQILAEHGFTGLVLYVSLIISIWGSLRRMIHKSKRDSSMKWFYNYSQMLEVSLSGFVISGLFLSMCYFDLFYQLVSITIILKQLFALQEREQRMVATQVTQPGILPAFS